MNKFFSILVILFALSGCATNSSTLEGGSLPKVYGSQYPLNQQLELASEHYNSANYAEAEKVYLNILQSHPRVAEVWYKLGNIYYRMGRFDASVEAYQTVIKIDSTHEKAWYNLSLARLSQAVEVLNFSIDSMDANSLYYQKSLRLRDSILGRVTKAKNDADSIDASDIQLGGNSR